MRREHFEVGETAVTIISDDEYIKIAKEAIFDAREQIEYKILQDPYFKTSYEPYEASRNDGTVVKNMCNAASAASVGPMAAVAGAVAGYAVKKMKDAGSAYAIVDNGGDIAMVCDREVCVGMYADVKGNRLSMLVPPTDRVLGICSSSASVGPSVSFGKSDISTVISNDVALADACATALGNMVRDRTSMEEHLEKICTICGVSGCLAYCDDMLAVCGNIPKLVRSAANDEIITRLRFG